MDNILVNNLIIKYENKKITIKDFKDEDIDTYKKKIIANLYKFVQLIFFQTQDKNIIKIKIGT